MAQLTNCMHRHGSSWRSDEMKLRGLHDENRRLIRRLGLCCRDFWPGAGSGSDFHGPAVGVRLLTALNLAQQVIQLLHDRPDLLAIAVETVPGIIEPDLADR